MALTSEETAHFLWSHWMRNWNISI